MAIREIIDGFTQWQSDPGTVCMNAEPDCEVKRGSGAETDISGKWRFGIIASYSAMPEDFALEGFSARAWHTVDLPHSFNTPMCEGILADIPAPYAPEEGNPIGCYLRTVSIPQSWMEKRIFIRFDDFSSAMMLYINGTRAAYAERAAGGARFEITDLIHPGVNHIAVQVFTLCTGSRLYGSGAAFAGLCGAVHLYVHPEQRITDLTISPGLNAHMRDGLLEARMDVAGRTDGLRAEMTVESGGGFEAIDSCDIQPDGTARLCATVAGVRLWSSETPFLYTVHVVLRGDFGILEERSYKIGFRKIEYKNGEFRINERRAALKGVVFDRAQYGPWLSRERTRELLGALREANVNAILLRRPCSTALYEWCDRLGIYVIDCVGFDTRYTLTARGGEYPALPGSRTDWVPAVMNGVRRMYDYDKNYTCVIGRALTADGIALGAAAEQAYRYLHTCDSGRFVLCCGDGPGHCSDLCLTDSEDSPDTPVVLRIFRTRGNTSPAVGQAVEQIYGNAPLHGVFVDSDVPVLFGEGRVSPILRALRKVYAPVRIRPIDITRGKMEFINRSDYFDLGDFSLSWEQIKGDQSLRGEEMYVRAAPGTSTVNDLELNEIYHGEWYLKFEVKSPDGRLLYSDIFPANEGRIDTPPEPVDLDPVLPEPHCTVTYGSIIVSGKGFEAVIDRTCGQMTSLTTRGTELLARPVRLGFWRAPTEEDNVSGRSLRSAFWRGAGDLAGGRIKSVMESGRTVRIETEYDIASLARAELCYTVTGGRIVFDYRLVPLETLPPLPEAGLIFEWTDALDRVRYIGLGDCENYPDRTGGADQGMYEQALDCFFEPYAHPQENGMRCDVRMMKFTGRDGLFVRVDSPDGVGVNLCKWSPYELESARDIAALPAKDSHTMRILAAQADLGGGGSYSLRADHPYTMRFTLSFIE